VPSGIATTSTVVVGYPATEILRFAEEQACGLIVMATHGLSGLQHFLIGSVTEKVVRKASCPVLTVRSFGSSLLERD
jgi:nucleotide-binding universal stress UspA family protein